MKYLRNKKSKFKVLSVLFLTLILLQSPFFLNATNVYKNSDDNEFKYTLFSGKIYEIQAEKENISVFVGEGLNRIIYHLKEDVKIIDVKSMKNLEIKNLKKNMIISVLIHKNTPMTNSLPPQISDVDAIFVNSNDIILDLSKYNEELVNLKNNIKLNISDFTIINDIENSNRMYQKEDLINKELLVIYSDFNKSTPLSVTPIYIMLLEKDELKYVPLRTKAESKGYEVVWTSHKNPIIIRKNDIEIKIKIGEKDFFYSHMTRDLQPLDLVEKLDLSPIVENGDTFVPSSFIDLLL